MARPTELLEDALDELLLRVAEGDEVAVGGGRGAAAALGAEGEGNRGVIGRVRLDVVQRVALNDAQDVAGVVGGVALLGLLDASRESSTLSPSKTVVVATAPTAW